MKVLSILVTVFTACTLFTACKSGSTGGTGAKVTPSGYNYTVHKDLAGDSPAVGDWASFSITVQGDNGKVLQEIPAGPSMPSLQIPAEDAPAAKPNPIIEVLKNASLGDSITIVMPIDSLGQPGNPQLAELKHIEYVIKVEKVQSDKDRKMEVESQRLEQEANAEKTKIRESEVANIVAETLKGFKSGKVTAEDKEGVKIVIHEEGSGKEVKNGARASMQYYGVLQSTGVEFDNSFKKGRPFTFTVGRGEVISGWDVGLLGLKKGAKATLFIPYTMAYGEAGRPGIPSKSDLVFYVEVEDVN